VSFNTFAPDEGPYESKHIAFYTKTNTVFITKIVV
jgi:hypothetical protein